MIDKQYLDDLRTKVGERLADAVNTEKYPKNESYAPDQEAEGRAEVDDSTRKTGRPQEGHQHTSTCFAS